MIVSLKCDITRIIKSSYYWIGVFSLFLALIYNTSTEWGLDPAINDVLYYYSVAHFQDLSLAMVIVSGIGAFLYISDWSSGFDYYAALRSGKRVYSHSKTISSFLAGPLVALAAELLFIGVLLVFMPLCLPDHPTLMNRALTTPFGYLLNNGHYILYLLIQLSYRLCGSLVLSSIAFVIAAYTKDFFVSLSSLFLIYFLSLLTVWSVNLPAALNFYAIFNGYAFECDIKSLLYLLLLTSAVVFVLGCAGKTCLERNLSK